MNRGIAALLGAISLIIFSESFRLINAREQRVLAQANITVDKRAEKRGHLQQLFIQSSQIIDTQIPKTISDEDFKKYQASIDKWLNESATWIEENLGPAAKAKFLDRSSAPFLMYDAAANTQHNNIINAMMAFRKNLSTLIETNAWDKS
jgi:tRNA/tmRNA/rRNA uracil-C5-methylase (TrmA/RlmC/RlmD family)